MADNKKYNETIAPAYENRQGFGSITLTKECMDQLKKAELGGKLIFKILRPESRKNEKSPHGYFELVSKAQVDEQRKYAKTSDKKEVAASEEPDDALSKF